MREHLLKNLYGFEYLIAPYTIAHLKLSQYLRDKGHSLREGERLQVFLTNTLEQVELDPKQAVLHNILPSLTAEVREAQSIKDKKILVIVGNPPYSGHSKNKGAWITGAVAKYREGFPELSKPAQGKWLQDDYVKFIRFAQLKMDDVEHGIVGIITNHSWIENPTFKGMRKSLLESFNSIYVLDLHGNAKKQERTPEGHKDENVFDIEQGVAITLLIKHKEAKGTYQSDFFGIRRAKYKSAASSSIKTLTWNDFTPRSPFWLLKPQNDLTSDEYLKFSSLPSVFGRSGEPAPGIVTTHDEFAISFTVQEATKKVERFLESTNEDQARTMFRLCSQDQWSYDRAKLELNALNTVELVTPVHYRPFDKRFTVWNKNVAVHRRERSTKHFLKGSLGLIFVRQASHEAQSASVYALVTQDVVDNRCFLSSKGTAFAVPLYVYADGNNRREEAFPPAFRDFLDARYDHHYEPEEILGYIYAVLHAPSYRARYAEFLRIDFPRIPFPEAKADFDRLSALGWSLVQVHLLRVKPKLKMARFHGKGTGIVESVRYSPEEQAVHINKTQHFSPVPPEVWGFHIGGYQVLDKYLKSRKGRLLSLDEIDHVSHVADALAFTIRQMQEINAAYGQAFPGRGSSGPSGVQ